MPTKADATPGRRVLVVEDNRDSAESMQVMLEMVGHTVSVAHDGPGGLDAIRRTRPDVVLCDIRLPGLSGFEVARAVRADPALATVRLVCLSGYGMPADRDRAVAAGFDVVVVKPADPRELFRLVADG